MAGKNLNQFQKTVLNNRLYLIKAEPAIDAKIDKRVRSIYRNIEDELVSLIGSKNKLTRTQVADVERKIASLRGKFQKISKKQLAEIQTLIGQTVKATHKSEIYKHLQMIDGHLAKFENRIGVSFNGINEKAIRASLSQSFPPGTVAQLFGNTAPAFHRTLKKDIAQAIADGWTVDRLAKKWESMSGATGAVRNHLQTVSRTMVMQASSNAQLFAYTSQADLVKGVQWEATFDSRTCSICAGRHGRQYPSTEAPPQPAHFNCILPWQSVDDSSAIAATRSRYEGTIVEIRTESGRVVSVTEKHPVLTERGFIAAGKLNVGDDLINCADAKRASSPIIPNDDEEPSRIEDFFNTLFESGSMRAVGVPTASEDFYGDAASSDGKVDIVWADGLLVDGIDSAISQPVGKPKFAIANSDTHRLFTGSRPFDELLSGLRLSANRVMSGGSQSQSLVGGKTSHSCSVCGGPTTNRDTGIRQSSADSGSGNSESHRERQLGLPLGVSRDKIVHIERKNYIGHVYDLQTVSGLIVADGIALSNCRCTWLPVFLDESLNNKLDSRTAYKSPSDLSLSFKQETREFDKWLSKAPAKTQKDFFGSRLKMKAWQDGQTDLASMISPHGWITDKTLLKMVDPAWAKSAVGGLNKITLPIKPKITPVPKGTLAPPIPKNPVPKPQPQSKAPAPITLPSEAAQSVPGTNPAKIAPDPPKQPTPPPAAPAKPAKAPSVQEIIASQPATANPDVLDASLMKQVGGQKGSNIGGLFEDSDGQKWYIKQPQTAAHADNEIIAAKLYELFGVNAPELKRANMNGKPGVASKWKNGLTQDGEQFASPNPPTGTREAFAVDAYLANWDVAGLSFDNIAIDASGKAFRLDTGGALLFRAQGTPKGSLFAGTVDELESLRNPAINPQSAKVFQSVTDQDIIDGIEKILSVPESEVMNIVTKFGKNMTTAQRTELMSKLSLRRADLEVKLHTLKSKKIGPDPIKKIAPAFGDDATKAAKAVDTTITAEDLAALKVDAGKPATVTKINPAKPKFKIDNPTPLKMPKGTAKQIEKYGYNLTKAGSKGHKQLVAKAEKGDTDAMYRLAERAAYGFNNEEPNFKRALYWLSRIDEFDIEGEIAEKVAKLRTGIENMQGLGAHFIPKTPLPSGAKAFVKAMGQLGTEINPKTGIAKAPKPFEMKIGPQPISAPKPTMPEVDLGEVKAQFQSPTLSGYGPMPSSPTGQVLAKNAGEFEQAAKDFLGLADGVNEGGIRVDANTYLQRIGDKASGYGKWVEFKREGPGKKWQATQQVHKSSGKVPQIQNWKIVEDSEPGGFYKPKKAIIEDTPPTPLDRPLEHTTFHRSSLFGDFGPEAPVQAKPSGMNLNKPTALRGKEYQSNIRNAWETATSEERDAIRTWSGSGYKNIRQILSGDLKKSGRTAYGTGENAHRDAFHMHNWLMRAPRHNSTVYRGLADIDRAQAAIDFKPGNKIYWNTHSSSSSKESVAMNFQGGGHGSKINVVLEVEGDQKVHIEGLSSCAAREAETIILARTEYEVVSMVQETSQRWRVVLKETGLNGDELIDEARKSNSTIRSITNEPLEEIIDEFEPIKSLFVGDQL